MKNKKLDLKQNWTKIKDKIAQQYADLIDNDLLFNEGLDETSFLTFYKKMLQNKESMKLGIQQ